MSKIDVSLFCSAVRPKIWPVLFKSLEGTSVSYEVVFVGNQEPSESNNTNYYPIGFNTLSHYTENNLNFIKTGDIKPAQCYEIAHRHCTGETVVWIADDCEFPNDVIGKAYKYWKSQNNEKLILSIQTKESGYGNPHGSLFNMDLHRFFGGDSNSPLMAPLAMMSRKFLDELGGIDRRYVCGQYENDIVMRAYTKGAKVEIFGDENTYIDIDHLGKSIAIGESVDENTFRERPFATGYEQDRRILENSWCKLNKDKVIMYHMMGHRQVTQSMIFEISNTQLDEFQPYPAEISLTKSEEPCGKWE